MIVGLKAMQVNVALLILTGALLLSIAQQDMTFLVLTAASVTFSLICIDSLRLFTVPNWAVNTLAFVVSIISMSQFAGGDAGSKLNAVANLLTYLQLVLLLQRKTPRLYWQIMMLSLLQVVVAAALNLDFGAAIAFFAYLMLAVMSLVHLNLYRREYSIHEAARVDEAKLTRLHQSMKPSGIAMVFRAGRTPLRHSLAWHSTLLATIGLFFAFTLFYSIPRFDSAWYGPRLAQLQVTGFTTEIRFGDEGFLKESGEPVMRVSFTNIDETPLRLVIEPYFRGLTLTDYSYAQGAWVWQNNENKILGRLGQGARRPPLPNGSNIDPDQPLMRQIVSLNPAAQVRLDPKSDSHLVFSVYPVFQNSRTPDDLVVRYGSRLIFRDALSTTQSLSGPYKYEILTPLHRNLGQLPATPLYLPRSNREVEYKARLLGKTFDRFESDWKPLADIATKVRLESPNPNDRRIVCNAMVNYLKQPDFAYTRALQEVKRDPSLDPIVDFVVNHKTGHCEFYATALALMLRSQGIPCRLISGFRGGDYNEMGKFYDVKEKHAHTWVEALLRPQDCFGTDMIRTGQASPEGAWLRLDATPASNLNDMNLSRNLVDQAGDAFGMVQKFWDDYVMGLDADSRATNGFDPASEKTAWFDPQVIAARFETLVENLKNLGWAFYLTTGCSLFLIIGTILYFRTKRRLKRANMTVSTMAILRQVLKNTIQTFNPIRYWTPANPDERLPDFFDEMESILAQHQFERALNQTPVEFADAVKQELLQREELTAVKFEPLSILIDQLIQSFYQQRFGKNGLSPSQRITVDEQLAQLQTELSKLNSGQSPQ